jgi:hypothetical protein
MIVIALIVVVLVAVVEVDVPRIVAIASIGSRRPIIVRRKNKHTIYAVTYRDAIGTDFYAHRQVYRTVKVARFTEVICKLWLYFTPLALLMATPPTSLTSIQPCLCLFTHCDCQQ